MRGMSIAFRAASYLGHVYLFEKTWSVMLETFLPNLDVRPEKVVSTTLSVSEVRT
jgi:hypothetical protein